MPFLYKKTLFLPKNNQTGGLSIAFSFYLQPLGFHHRGCRTNSPIRKMSDCMTVYSALTVTNRCMNRCVHIRSWRTQPESWCRCSSHRSNASDRQCCSRRTDKPDRVVADSNSYYLADHAPIRTCSSTLNTTNKL